MTNLQNHDTGRENFNLLCLYWVLPPQLPHLHLGKWGCTHPRQPQTLLPAPTIRARVTGWRFWLVWRSLLGLTLIANDAPSISASPCRKSHFNATTILRLLLNIMFKLGLLRRNLHHCSKLLTHHQRLLMRKVRKHGVERGPTELLNRN